MPNLVGPGPIPVASVARFDGCRSKLGRNRSEFGRFQTKASDRCGLSACPKIGHLWPEFDRPCRTQFGRIRPGVGSDFDQSWPELNTHRAASEVQQHGLRSETFAEQPSLRGWAQGRENMFGVCARDYCTKLPLSLHKAPPKRRLPTPPRDRARARTTHLTHRPTHTRRDQTHTHTHTYCKAGSVRALRLQRKMVQSYKVPNDTIAEHKPRNAESGAHGAMA